MSIIENVVCEIIQPLSLRRSEQFRRARRIPFIRFWWTLRTSVLGHLKHRARQSAAAILHPKRRARATMSAPPGAMMAGASSGEPRCARACQSGSVSARANTLCGAPAHSSLVIVRMV